LVNFSFSPTHQVPFAVFSETNSLFPRLFPLKGQLDPFLLISLRTFFFLLGGPARLLVLPFSLTLIFFLRRSPSFSLFVYILFFHQNPLPGTPFLSFFQFPPKVTLFRSAFFLDVGFFPEKVPQAFPPHIFSVKSVASFFGQGLSLRRRTFLGPFSSGLSPLYGGRYPPFFYFSGGISFPFLWG